MNIVADESVDRPIVDRLRRDGHRVMYIADTEPGMSDDDVLDAANREDAPLLTADHDFGELVFRQQRLAPGVVLIRLAGLSPASKAEIVSNALSVHGAELRRAFTVITPAGLRIRPQHRQ